MIIMNYYLLTAALFSTLSFGADMSDSVVQLHTSSNTACTAFSMTPLRYVTAAHCVQSTLTKARPETLVLTGKNGYRVEAYIQYVDEKHDVAIVLVDEVIPGVNAVTFDPYEQEVGSPVYTIGNVFNLGWVKESGSVKSIQSWDILTSLNGNPGFSGAPVFNAQNKVIGVLSYGLISKEGQHVYTGVRKIKWVEGR